MAHEPRALGVGCPTESMGDGRGDAVHLVAQSCEVAPTRRHHALLGLGVDEAAILLGASEGKRVLGHIAPLPLAGVPLLQMIMGIHPQAGPWVRANPVPSRPPCVRGHRRRPRRSTTLAGRRMPCSTARRTGCHPHPDPRKLREQTLCRVRRRLDQGGAGSLSAPSRLPSSSRHQAARSGRVGTASSRAVSRSPEVARPSTPHA